MKLLFTSLLMTTAATLAAGTVASAGEPNLVTRRYSKEELKSDKPEFIRSRDLATVLSEKISLIAATITQRQGGSNLKLLEMGQASTQISRETHMKRLGTLVYDPDTKTNVDGDSVRTHLSGQARKSVEVKFKEAFPFMDEIRRGVSFKFSFNKKDEAKAPQTPDIRYGLVVQDIMPGDAPAVASLGTSDMQMEYAAPARVVYTIDRINEASGRKVFSDPKTTESYTTTPTSTDVWKRPSTDLDVKVEAANTEDSVSDKMSAGALPGAKVTLSQVDGLWATQVVTTSRLGKDTITHEAKLPIYGEANLARKFDEKMKPIQTSLNSILAKPGRPKANLHYLHVEEKYRGELMVQRKNTDVSLIVEPRQGWQPGKKSGLEGDKVSVGVTHSF